MPPLGISFTENLGGQPPGEEQGPGGAAPVSPLQSAIQMLSLRLPRVVGANALAPQALLQGGGGGGAGLSPEVLQMILQRLRLIGGGAGPVGLPGPEATPLTRGPGGFGGGGMIGPGAPVSGPAPTPRIGYTPPGAGPMPPPPGPMPMGGSAIAPSPMPPPPLPTPRFTPAIESGEGYAPPPEYVEKIPATGGSEPPLLQPGPWSPQPVPIEPAGPGGEEWEFHRALNRLRQPGLSPY